MSASAGEKSGVPRDQRVPARVKAYVSLVAAGAVALAAIVASAALAPAGGGSPRQVMAAAGVNVTVSPPWRAAPAGAGPIGAIELRDGRSLAIRGAAGPAVAQFGWVAAPSSVHGGAPPAMRRASAGPVRATAVRIGTIAATRYGAQLRGAGDVVRAYVFATDAGDFAVTCRLKAVAAVEACDDLAASARFPGVRVVTPGPDAALARTLARALAPLARSRAGKGVAARDLRARARNAGSLAAAAAAAAEVLDGVAGPPADVAAVLRAVRALRSEAVALRALGRATQGGDRRTYAQARDRITSAERSLRRALHDLTAMGYAIRVAP